MFADVPIGTVFSRVYHQDRDPVFFGRTQNNRFDSPDGSFGVLYVGYDEHCAFIETFGHETRVRLITRQALAQRQLIYFEVNKPLKLIDLFGSGGLARIGADAGLFSGPHAMAQRWSAALRKHSAKPAGIIFPARHDPQRRSCALFELPDGTLLVKKTGSFLEPHHAKLLGEILNTYDFGLID